MVARTLWITLQQVVRSVLILLFPIAFITLFAWATAGSAYGSTADPMRAAVWLWLASHLAPFNVTSNEISGYLSYLPVGALILPWITIRFGYKRVLAIIGNKKVSRAYFILIYLIIFLLLAISASNIQVSVDYPRASLTVFIILFLATTQINFEKNIALSGYLFSIMLGIAGLIFTLSLALNFTTAKNLTVVIQPGIFGGVLLLLLQLLYLPNILFSALSYILGAGFSLGSQTYVSPFVFNLQEIPAIPILAALPNGKNFGVLIFSILMIFYAIINFQQINKLTLHSKIKKQVVIRFFVVSTGASALMALASSGSLLSANMSPVGVNPLIISSVVLGYLLIIFVILTIINKVVIQKNNRNRLST